MKRWTLPAAAAVLLAMAWSHWPAVAQRAPQPAPAGDMITFDQYRDFRARDLQQRQVRLARQLAEPGISAAEKASIERRKAYYDRVAAMPADERGEMVGVVGRNEALEMAADAGLDLVEVAPNADPPVCKILDYGKFKYEEQKKKNEARKKQKIIEVKEIKLRPSIDIHDYAVKMRSMNKFIEEGDKVKVTMRFRGREMVHQELGLKVLERVRGQLDEVAKVEQMPRLEGRQMTMVIAPK